MPRSSLKVRGALLQQGRFGGGTVPPAPTDTTAPVITSGSSFSVNEGVAYSATASANEKVTWTKSGTDAGLVTLNATTGAWSVPAQTNASKPTVVFSLTATDLAGNTVSKSITLTIKAVVPVTDYFAEPTGGSLDMTGWNVSIPVANSSGVATTIEPATEAAISAQSSKITVAKVHQYYEVTENFLYFAVPWDATIVTSTNTSYPRSELRELIYNGSNWDDDEWQPSTGTHILDVTCRVESLTMRADGNYAMTDIGQIHGANNEPCRLFYRPIENGGTVGEVGYYNDKWNGTDGQTLGSEGDVVLKKNGNGVAATVSLNEVFSYRIHVSNNILTISAVIRGENYSHSQTLHSFWKDDPCYFKAGNYRQANRTKKESARKAVSGTTVVKIYNIVKTHSNDTVYYGQ